MSDAPTRTGVTAPRVVTLVLSVVAIALAVVAAVLVVQRHGHERGLTLTKEEVRVLDSAKQDFVTLQTFRRTSFDQDFANASSVVTGSAKKNLASTKDNVLKLLTTNKTNSTASIESASIVSKVGQNYQVLILSSLETRNDAGKLIQSRPSPATLTMTKSGGLWLISDVQLVSVS